MKKVPGAAQLEHRAVDREQDDVGRGDVERHAEDALERHVERPDQPIDAVAAVREDAEADVVEDRTEQRVEQERGGGDRQDPADGAACRFEHQHDRERCRATRSIGGRLGGAVDEAGEISERPAERDDREADQQPVDRRNRRSPASAGLSAVALAKVEPGEAGNSRNVRTSATSRKLTR